MTNKNDEYREILTTHIGSSTCKYNRQGNEKFDLDGLGPKGLCLDLYHSAYPYCLAMLYGAVFSWEEDPEAVHAQCPAPGGNIHYEVRRKRLPEIIEVNGIKKKMEVWINIIDRQKVEEGETAGCQCSHEYGESYEFNQGDYRGQMCPAAFNNIWPEIKALNSGGKTPWITDDGMARGQCPDNIPKIQFEITKNLNDLQ